MRSLLGGWSPAVVSVFVAVELLACPRVAAPQSKETAPARPQGAAMRSVVQTASNGEVALDRRVSARLDSAQGVLFDGRYAEALTAFGAVLESDDARGNYAWTTWAQHVGSPRSSRAFQRNPETLSRLGPVPWTYRHAPSKPGGTSR